MAPSHRRLRAGSMVAAALVLGAALAVPPSMAGDSGRSKPPPGDTELAAAIDAHIASVNEGLEARGASIRLHSAEAFLLGYGLLRVGNRFKKYYGQRWVPGDERREADGDRLTYLVDQSDGATSSGLTNAQTEAAIDRAAQTWAAEPCLAAAPLVKRADTGADPDIVDSGVLPLEYEEGNPFLADITFAGWYPVSLFLAWAPSFEGRVLAFSETYVFSDEVTFEPTDVNGDQYLDTALNEVYFNDMLGDPNGPFPDRPWAIDPPLGGPEFDVETIALHEMGHSLGLGHFGPAPLAIMNPAPPRSAEPPHTYPSDSSAICSLYSSWPRP
ncbi:matrixin family metalloprotease [Nocardioides sp. WS12]|uniref:matrixin family metalloprotease n=1 Tax=Nocardioides sp. WS12 TaxID=2486272 RepID=UPI0015FC4422|nr:matrixin family metalloprotease [Nocardioides sp. WS12]